MDESLPLKGWGHPQTDSDSLSGPSQEIAQCGIGGFRRSPSVSEGDGATSQEKTI
ncbi:MAG: hypothetical protein WAN66_06645 [Limnoraphis robusta]|uniref:hypothetical protein n=1 Tax=Limnoraphis robusta TaxID=1118279 RepID=UPI002B1EA21B|nr:hypothetical protein [Limnoraphis robusta]MEA5499820.1 hypothetical protein [Limnoraphis robusta BA-68 BA1]